MNIFQVKGKEKKSEIRRRKITREGKIGEGKNEIKMDRYFQNVLIDFTERWGRGEMEKRRKSERRRRIGYEREMGEGRNKKK